MAYPTVKKLLNRGPASNNRFSATFGSCRALGNTRTLNEYSRYFISNMTMPGSSIATGEMFGDVATGISRKYAHTRMYNEFAMTFILEAGMEVYDIFDAWIENIVTKEAGKTLPTANHRVGYYDDYVCNDIILKKYERDGSLSLTTTVYNAFPLNISDLSLSSASQNSLLELTINFAYETYTTNTGGVSSEGVSGDGESGKSNGLGYADVKYEAVEPLLSNSLLGLSDFGSFTDFNPLNNKIMAIKDRENMQKYDRVKAKGRDSGGGSSAGTTAPNPGSNPNTSGPNGSKSTGTGRGRQ